MHELSIALGIIDAASEEAERRGAKRVVAVHLRLGQMAGVVKEALNSSYGLAAESTPLEGSKLVIEDIAITIRCPACNGPRPVVSLQDLRCRECHAVSGEIVTGRELEVTAMEIVT
ncbi:MAG TPA: hydrogenase maturation nickel metallochaperone HypA [Tepidisphaeraceae bacterium]|jgi:hydrogenase nickel incorporation protein HypA/HybF|nr:hydrogenase maturation nickel metallochaperone HypA [Tepidisphaeraceae bacterium]